jgi:hypothetical protein
MQIVFNWKDLRKEFQKQDNQNSASVSVNFALVF